MRKILLVFICAIFLINLVSAVANYSDCSDKIFFYKYNEISGTAIADECARFNTNYDAGQPTRITSLINYGNAGNISSGSTHGADTGFQPSALQTANLSLEFRVKYSSSANTLVMGTVSGADPTKKGFTISGGSDLHVIANNGVGTVVNDFSFGCPSSNNDIWHHYVLTINSTDGFTMYQDGLRCTNSISGSINGASTTNFFLHNRPTMNAGWNGALDQVIWWNKTLTLAEIVSLNNSLNDYSVVSEALITVNSLYPNNGDLITTGYFNSSATPTNSNITNATLNIWYSNGTIFNQTLNTVKGNVNNFTSWTINNLGIGNYKFNTYWCSANATASVCSWYYTNNSFSVGATLSSISYVGTDYETANSTFISSFNLIAGSQLSLARLVYNGTNYTITDLTQNSTNAILTKSIMLPLNRNSSGIDLNDFYFIFTYSGSVTQQTNNFYQNVSYIDLRYCTTQPYNTTALNITIKDEKIDSELNPAGSAITYQTTFKYWLGDGTINKSYSYQTINSTSLNNFKFCIYPFDKIFKTNMDAQFEAINYASNEYHLKNAVLSQNYTDLSLYLYLLSQASSTKFYITIKNGIEAIPQAFTTISKYFVGSGVYKTTSIRITDDTGKFPMYMDLDAKYEFSIISQEGNILGVINKIASCASAPCSIDINLKDTAGNIFQSYGDTYASNVVSNLSFNPNNKIVTYTFLDITGLAHYFRLEVNKVSLNNTQGSSICDSTTYSSFGTMTCNVTGYSGDFFAKGYISRSPEKLDKILSFIVNTDVINNLGYMGLFLNFAILIVVVVAGAVISKGSPTVIVFMLGIAILALKLFGIFPFTWIVVSSLELLIIYFIINLKT